MNLANYKNQISDKLSICLSICCILHCIALPVVILVLPGLASYWISDENVHVVLVLLAIPISLFAMGVSLRKHHNYKCIALAGAGLALLVLAIFMHDIGFSGEHGHVEHANEEQGHEKHEDGELGHEEHGGLGETIETVFTVLGGLILLSAHFLNIRLTNKAV